MRRAEYKKLLEGMREWYRTIGTVHCPYLKAGVAFNSKGFYHLRYDSAGKERPLETQIKRLRLLPFAPDIIGSAKDICEYRAPQKGSREYWAFEDRGIRVVLMKTGSGNIMFLSVLEAQDKQKDPPGHGESV